MDALEAAAGDRVKGATSEEGAAVEEDAGAASGLGSGGPGSFIRRANQRARRAEISSVKVPETASAARIDGLAHIVMRDGSRLAHCTRALEIALSTQ